MPLEIYFLWVYNKSLFTLYQAPQNWIHHWFYPFSQVPTLICQEFFYLSAVSNYIRYWPFPITATAPSLVEVSMISHWHCCYLCQETSWLLSQIQLYFVEMFSLHKTEWHFQNANSVQFSSVSDPCDPVDCSMPGLPVHHRFLELAQTRVHWVGDDIQPSHLL